ncbi:FUSC family protein [Corynebacterium uropygiale]|uniref:FUSC family protein n=1 Tax=Corynebacterium uropygiale TaxID=1775911 RepID=A0A9X1TXJ3_9CORY|nr:FUSC family protein [Corynebacterium uropygiale]MCF4006155.1 FUSC family protein [Corynebacterium uropygiale]
MSGAWRLFTNFHSPAPRWPTALKLAAALVVPAAVALLLGLDQEMLLIAAGGYSVVYGEGLPLRTRWRSILTAGVFIVMASMAGAFVGTVTWNEIAGDGTSWWLLLIVVYTTILAALGTFCQNALRLPPPGSFFIVMVGGGSTMVARLGLNPVDVGFWAIFGVLSALVMGVGPLLFHRRAPQYRAVAVLEKAVEDFINAPQPAIAKNHQAQAALADTWATLSDAGVVRGGRIQDASQADLVRRTVAAHHRLVNASTMAPAREKESQLTETPSYVDLSRNAIPHSRPSHLYRIYRSIHPYSHATITTCKVILASLLAGTITIALGFDRPDWTVVSAMLVLQWGPDKLPGTIRGLHRLLGSLLGIILFGAFHMLGVHGWTLLAAIAVCQFCAEIFVTRNYALCVIFATPLALLMGNSIALPLLPVVTSRVCEVFFAILFSLLFLWLWMPNSEPKHYARLVDRCYRAMGSLLGALMTMPPNEALAQRRDLQYELLAERRAVTSLVANHPASRTSTWPQHTSIQEAGYALLDYCTAHADEELSLTELSQLTTKIREARTTTKF